MLSSIMIARCAVKENIKLVPLLITRQVHKKRAEKAVPVGSSFSTVYRLPQISMCSIINKFKKYQLLAFGAGTPIAFGLNAFDVCDQYEVATFMCVGVASTVAVLTIGQVFTNLVGMAYISKDRARVKISYLNFWGDRCDKTVDSSDIVGITTKPSVPWDNLTIRDDPTRYKISLRFGEITMTPLFKTALKHDPDTHLPET